MIRSALLALGACLALLGCAAGNPPPADPAEIARRAYVSAGPAELVLLTVRGVEKDEGAHTALLVSGSQRVLWDPAGSFRHPEVPEVGDVLFGFSPLIETVYTDYHVRPDFYVVRQKIPVTRATADRLISMMRAHGATGQATCARTTSAMLRDAGFDVGRTWYPNSLVNDVGRIPGVVTRRIDTSNVDTNHDVVFGKNGVPLPRGA